jgi:superfamily II DNA or RNA helicase
MSDTAAADGSKPLGWRSGNIWASSETFGSNPVKQLMVPASVFQTVGNLDGVLEIRNNYGVWAATTADRPLADDVLWAKLPVGTKAGDQLRSASWNLPRPLARSSPADVVSSYKDALTFNEGTTNVPGLRSPQLGAVHAVLGYWTTKRTTPSTVVMPTGTGKTETMLALLVAARLPRLLVLVPSDALREQVANKFETLGVLQELGIVGSQAVRPVVGRVQTGFTDVDQTSAFVEACNVIVATPQSLSVASQEALDVLVSGCSHLFVDEAHHVAARTWYAIREMFVDKDVVQFTATPFREDGKHLQGRTIYSFPLREAQAQKYFTNIDYTSVIDFDDVDKALADQSIAKLRDDLSQGFDHVLMARAGSIGRAKEVLVYYEQLAPELHPVVINSKMPKSQQREALTALHNRVARIIVCVNMLGEGFDLPALKVAAVHDPQKSLAVTLQFIGRFARTSFRGNFGGASMFVARAEIGIDRRLRELYAEDSDWNLILRNLTEVAVDEQQAVSDFEDGFTSLPDEISLRTLLPKMSTVVYRAPASHWEPQNIVDYFGEGNLFTDPIGLNSQANVAWCIVERHTEVRWGNVRSLEDVSYELYVLYFDSARRLLYINNSANDGVFEDLAEAVLGEGAKRFTGSTVYRVLANIDRLVPTNVGVLDAHDQFRRFSMHVGSDVTASFSQAEAGTKSQTNISGGGYRDGEHVSMSASLKGRIWSQATAPSLKYWRDWCDGVGNQLLDDTISIDRVIGQFILPEALKRRPEGVLLAVEWPWDVHLMQAESLRLSYNDKVYEAVHTDLVPDTGNTSDVLRFSIRSGAWNVIYEASVEKGRLRYHCKEGPEIKVIRPHSEQTLSEWLNANGLLFVLDDDRIIERDLVYKPTWDKPPYDRSQLTALDWSGINLKIESQTKEKLPESIQHRALTELKREEWDVVIDDDGAGEIADIVALRIDPEGLLVRMVHCKYSRDTAPGARVADLYEVCGQAQKSIMWRRSDLLPFFKTLDDRARKKYRREGVSPFEVGDSRKLYELQERATVVRRRVEMVIVQPGLSVAGATNQQLDLLASTQAYLKTTIKASLTVWCSA